MRHPPGSALSVSQPAGAVVNKKRKEHPQIVRRGRSRCIDHVDIRRRLDSDRPQPSDPCLRGPTPAVATGAKGPLQQTSFASTQEKCLHGTASGCFGQYFRLGEQGWSGAKGSARRLQYNITPTQRTACRGLDRPNRSPPLSHVAQDATWRTRVQCSAFCAIGSVLIHRPRGKGP